MFWAHFIPTSQLLGMFHPRLLSNHEESFSVQLDAEGAARAETVEMPLSCTQLLLSRTTRRYYKEVFYAKFWKFYMAVWALNVKLTGPLVVTAGSALENYPWWTSRELQRTSGTRFRTLFWEPFKERQVIRAPSDRRS